MNIQPLTASASKADEFNMLRKMQTLAGEQTYLAGLLSDALIDWVKTQINNDLSADIYGAYNHANAMVMEQTAKRHELAEDAKNDAARAKLELENANAEIARLNGWMDTFSAHLEKERDRTASLRQELGEVTQELINANCKLAAKEDEIKALKALLYDLEHASH